MTDITLIFPHQLYEDHPALKKERKVVMVEDSLFFLQYNFHKMKLVLHRASMRHYKKELERKGYTVWYIDATEQRTITSVLEGFKLHKIETIHYAETSDYLLELRLRKSAAQHHIKLVCHPNPDFLCERNYLDDYFNKKKRYYLTEFYIEQRKRLKILFDSAQPQGGQWTFDTENRKKIPASVQPPPRTPLANQDEVTAASDYVDRHFSTNYGSTRNFFYPVTAHDARTALTEFLKKRFLHYGIYQDAIREEDSFLFHSLVSSSLNIGLLKPVEIIDAAIKAASLYKTPINSLEGFIRQVLGWREFVRAVYEREGVKQRTRNYWNHKRKIPNSFWKGDTGIAPLDNVIKKALGTAYCSHIERLMIAGNLMLLCEFHPDEVYRWFMELFIDSYDWVMVPNVYGMSQYADGGLMSTKPYISGSNYILKMSNYPKGPWCELWDCLYWRFIDKHKEEFIKNPRMSMMVKQLEKMDEIKRQRVQSVSEKFLAGLDQQNTSID